MNLYLPNNIYTSFLKAILPKDIAAIEKPSALVVKELERDTQAIALIPSLELITNKELLVSGKFAISFDGILSNAYFYFPEGQRNIPKVLVRGDVSKNEILLSKILFEELYGANAEFVLDSSKEIIPGKNYLICGDENFVNQKYLNGMSLSDEIAELLDHPYVNYVFVSKDRESLTNFSKIFDSIDDELEKRFEEILNMFNLNEADKEFISANFSSVYFDLTENEKDGLNELIKLLYYHGIIEDMFDVKLI